MPYAITVPAMRMNRMNKNFARPRSRFLDIVLPPGYYVSVEHCSCPELSRSYIHTFLVCPLFSVSQPAQVPQGAHARQKEIGASPHRNELGHIHDPPPP